MEFTDEKEQLDYVRELLLEHLFDSDNKQIKKWEKNKPVLTGAKWNFMLSYPTDFNKFRDNNITKEELASIIGELLIKNTDRIIHPGLILLCWENLSKYVRPEYCYNNQGEPDYLSLVAGPELPKLRYQIRVSWQIYIGLLSDRKIKEFFSAHESDELLVNFRTKLFFNFQIEKMVRMNLNIYDGCNVRFNDLCLDLQLDDKVYYSQVEKKLIDANILDEKNTNASETQIEYKKKIIVEINESHHVPIIDNLRKLNIYQITGRLSVDYPVAEMSFHTIYSKILKEVGKILYKYYSNRHGIVFYMCCIDNFDITYIPTFWEFYKKTVLEKTGIPVEDVMNILRDVSKCKKSIIAKFYNVLKEELTDDIYYIEKNQENFTSSLLSNYGVDRLLLLPRKADFENYHSILNISHEYTHFREKVFSSIIEFLNGNDESVYIFKMINHINQMTEISENIIKPVIEIIYNRLTPETISAIESTYRIKLLKPLPFLMRTTSKYDSVDKQGLSNVVTKPLAEIIQKKFEPGLPTIESHKFIPNHVVQALITGHVTK